MMLFNSSSRSEINDLDFETLREFVNNRIGTRLVQKDNILQLQIPMHNGLVTEIGQHRQQLLHNDLNGHFRELNLPLNVKLLQTTTITILSNHIIVAIIKKQIIKLNNVGMINSLQKIDFRDEIDFRLVVH